MTTPKEAAREFARAILPRQTLPDRVREVANLIQERDREQRLAGRREGAEAMFDNLLGCLDSDYAQDYDKEAELEAVLAAGLHEFVSLGFTRGQGPIEAGTEILKCVHCGAQAMDSGDGNLGDGWKNSECPKRGGQVEL